MKEIYTTFVCIVLAISFDEVVSQPKVNSVVYVK